jgi:hypothetical protein
VPSQNCSLQPMFLSPDDIDVDLGRKYRLGLTRNLSTRVLWPSPETSVKRVGDGRRKLEFRLSISVGLEEFSLTCCKILRHGNSGFTSHPKECVLLIFIALKNPSPWLGSNPLPFGPVASTLITIKPKRLILDVTALENRMLYSVINTSTGTHLGAGVAQSV